MSLTEVLKLPNLTGAEFRWPSAKGLIVGTVSMAHREGREFVVLLSCASRVKDSSRDPRHANYAITFESYEGNKELRLSIHDSFRVLGGGVVKITSRVGTITLHTKEDGDTPPLGPSAPLPIP